VSELTIRPLAAGEFEDVLPLIADYQRFYGVAQPDRARNREFFAQFVAPSEVGALLGAWQTRAGLVGYACLYWTFSSVSAQPVVLMNDLFVVPAERGAGVGLALIDAARAVARSRGVDGVRWQTALDNRRAQRLYERTDAKRSTWFEYELDA
jgi:GNAT superfamily N-acetyltransferase